MVDLVGLDLVAFDPALGIDEVDVILHRRAQPDADDLGRPGAVALIADHDLALLLRRCGSGEAQRPGRGDRAGYQRHPIFHCIPP
jgi:hypothetical protein